MQLPAFTEAETIRAAATVAARTYPRELGSIVRTRTPFSIHRLIRGMLEKKGAQSFEDEVCAAAAAACGRRDLGSHQRLVPWGALDTRDLAVGTPSRGGNLVGTNVTSAIDVLRPFSVVARMGVTVEENLIQNLTRPNIATPNSGNWLATEASPITAVDPVVGQTATMPKMFGAMIKASHLLYKQSLGFDAFVTQQLTAACAGAIDAAVLNGSGSSGQPTGLSLISGTGISSGAVTAANMLDAIETVANAKADDQALAFLTTPSVRRLLQLREVISTSGRTVWSGNTLMDRPAYVSTDCPASTIFLGDWSKVVVSFFGPGVEISIDPYTNFALGGIQIRVLMFVDVSFPKPAAFHRHTSAT